MIMNVLIFVLGTVAFTTFCSEEPRQNNFVFKGWLLNKDFFGNLEKVECRKKEVDKDCVIIEEKCKLLVCREREIDLRAVAFAEKLHGHTERDEKKFL